MPPLRFAHRIQDGCGLTPPVTGNLLRRGCWGRAVHRLASFLELFTQSWSGPEPLRRIALALMLVHSSVGLMGAM
jgi:hypothetical protein